MHNCWKTDVTNTQICMDVKSEPLIKFSGEIQLHLLKKEPFEYG